MERLALVVAMVVGFEGLLAAGYVLFHALSKNLYAYAAWSLLPGVFALYAAVLLILRIRRSRVIARAR